MRIVGIYPFNNGVEYVKEKYPKELAEIERAIQSIDASLYKTKESKEKTMKGEMLFSPVELNEAFKKQLNPLNWSNVKEQCEYSTEFYVEGYQSPIESRRYPFRDMDFVKNKVGVEVQFGKYSFMVYNVCAKMTIFKKLGHIDAGIEIVPVKELADQMSTGVSYFEQFTWDLEKRGVSDIDIPVMILGIAE
jgi:hypothetical protein